MEAPYRARLAIAAVLLAAVGVSAPGASAAAEGDAQDALRAVVESEGRGDARRFYAGRDHAPAWLEAGRPTARGRALAEALARAAEKGLRPEDYDGPRWAERLARLSGPAVATAAELARFDLALTVCAARYASDLQFGRVSPRSVRIDLPLPHGDEEGPLEFLRQAAGAGELAAALDGLEPPFPAYRRTEAALGAYRALASEGEPAPLPVPARPVRPGQPYSALPELGGRLRRLGDLAGDAARERRGPPLYGGALVEAVRRFQARHGLDPDGRLDARTVRALNVPASRRAVQLALALERWRWLPHRFAAPPVVVNLPEFRLYARAPGGAPALSMKVVVGRAYRTATPVFAAEMRSVKLRPAWHVPRSIATGELAPRLRHDPALLEREGYDLLDRRGAVVAPPPPAELAARVASGELRLRQRPGAHNALGTVKFVLPNAYDVYLHGTPARALFARSRRDFSHGCIRLEDPVALAAWVLRDRPDWPPERIRAAMDGAASLEVRLSRPIPVLVVYATAVVPESGEVRFLDDLYGHDAALERALAALRARPTERGRAARDDLVPPSWRRGPAASD